MTEDDDWALFQKELADVAPIQTKAVVEKPKAAIARDSLQYRRKAATAANESGVNPLLDADYVPMVKPWDFLEFKRDGIQEGVYKKFRLGKYAIETRLDLHGMTVEQARQAVFTTIRDAHQQDLRMLIISHGRGEGRNPPALLKSCVNHWLKQLEPVVAYHSAQRHHGGVGATYVMLRKSANAKLKTKQVLFQK